MEKKINFRKKKTHRGFDYREFEDLYGAKCSIQKSSLATDHAIWFGIDDADPKIGPPWRAYKLPENILLTTRMHLNIKLVKKLLPVLQKFVETGEI